MLDGVQNKQAELRAIQILKRLERVDPMPQDYETAITYSPQFHLSHGVQANDCLIAAVAVRLQMPLYTTNLKHFTPILGSLAQKPY